MEYQDFPKRDLLILDEFYKLSAKRDDLFTMARNLYP